MVPRECSFASRVYTPKPSSESVMPCKSNPYDPESRKTVRLRFGVQGLGKPVATKV